MQIHRNDGDITEGRFQYYVFFKPHALEDGEVRTRVPVVAAVSVSETGDLVDVSFELPKPIRTEQALSFIRSQEAADYVPPHVHIAVPGKSGDAVSTAPANLDLDLAGRIVGMEIEWIPGGGRA
jgi:hypothetical protein